MNSRLSRYKSFITHQYIDGLLKGDEYSLAGITPGLQGTLDRRVDRIVFTGMGCSAIVSDVFRGAMKSMEAELEVLVVNDYDLGAVLPPAVLEDRRTLFVISSYSGHSTEPIMAFEQLRAQRDQVLLLTSGGRLAELGRETGTSIAYWQLSRPDREYPLFHVTQYFAILQQMFAELGLISPQDGCDLPALVAFLEDERPRSRELGERLAYAAHGANVLMIAHPIWHDAALKLAKMHLNEIAMVPAGRNLFHEFCHSEVATLSDPERAHCVIMLSDPDEDAYTHDKRARLERLLTADLPQNRNVKAHVLKLRGTTFEEKLFSALDVIQFMTAALTKMDETASRDLISESAGNPWYHSTTIAREFAEAS
jgi:glucose/mannose-6-phosphate isomerase